MGEVIFWLVDTPAWLLGSALAWGWAVVAVVATVGTGVLVYRRLAGQPQPVALFLAVLVGLYAGMVFFQAQAHLGRALIEMRYDRDY